MKTLSRTHNVSVRLNDREFNRLNHLCHVLHENKGTILRLNLHTAKGGLKRVRGTHKVPQHEWSKEDFNALNVLNDLRIQLARTGNLINQIARSANVTGVKLDTADLDHLAELRNETDAVKAVIRKVADKS